VSPFATAICVRTRVHARARRVSGRSPEAPRCRSAPVTRGPSPWLSARVPPDRSGARRERPVRKTVLAPPWGNARANQAAQRRRQANMPFARAPRARDSRRLSYSASPSAYLARARGETHHVVAF